VARRDYFRVPQTTKRAYRKVVPASLCTFTAEVSLRSTFQRSRGIIKKRLAPFHLERPGFTSRCPQTSLTLNDVHSLATVSPSLHTAPSSLPLTRYARSICRSTAFHSRIHPSLRSGCARRPSGPPHGLATTQRAPVAHAQPVNRSSFL
jgi:hypothetical protein